jgi:uncharacterized protein (TIGR02996 family)
LHEKRDEDFEGREARRSELGIKSRSSMSCRNVGRMGSVLAIVSKKIFERDFRCDDRPAAPGDVVATDRYTSAHKTLDGLLAGGDLFLVTVAAGEQLWLVGVLQEPRFTKDAWTAAVNTTPITDVSHLIGKLQFESGKGITARAGALAMSLQTPRGLGDADVELLRGASSKKTKPALKQVSTKPAKPSNAAAPRARKPKQGEPAAPGTNPELGRAKAYLEAGALVAALDELLHAWARHRSQEVAGLIDALGGAIARSLPVIQGNKKTIDSAWRDVADQMRSADVPRLATALDLGSAPQAEGWLDVLEQFPIDPRLCAPAIELSMKFVSSSAGPTRTRAFRIAETIADGRCLPQIDAILKKNLNAWNAKELKERVRKLKTKFQPPPALSAPDAKLVKELGKQVDRIAKQPPLAEAALFQTAPRTEDDGARLLAEVLTDPQSDAPRLVYADYLQQHDDPRGELIALQMLRRDGAQTRAQAQRERELLRDKQLVKRWLGPLGAVVSEPRFDRGFLHSCHVKFATAKQRADLIGHPLWATVESIDCTELALVVSPAMRSLQEVSGLDTADVLELARRVEPLKLAALTHLHFEADDEDDDRPAWKTILEVGALTNLRRLGPLYTNWSTHETLGTEVAGWKWLVDSKLVKQLTHLTLHLGPDKPSIAPWLALFDQRPKLERLEIQSGVYRNSGGSYIDLSCIATRSGGTLALTLELARLGDMTRLRQNDIDLPVTLFEGIRVPALAVIVTARCTKPQLELLHAHMTRTFGHVFGNISVAARD